MNDMPSNEPNNQTLMSRDGAEVPNCLFLAALGLSFANNITFHLLEVKQEAGVVHWIMDICCLVGLSVFVRIMKMACTCSCRNNAESSPVGRLHGRSQTA